MIPKPLHKATSVNITLQNLSVGESMDTIEEPKEMYSSMHTSSPRKKVKAFTQMEHRKSVVFEDEEDKGMSEEDFEHRLIKSTKRRYSFDEPAQSLVQLEEEERKACAASIMVDIKRNEIKKKRFLQSEANAKQKEDVLEVQQSMSEETVSMIKKTLKSHFLFGNMDMIQM